MAGYSGTPLIRKLGLKPGMSARYLAPRGAAPRPRLGRGLPAATGRAPFDFVHGFVVTRAQLVRQLAAVLPSLAPDGMYWVSWPKRASGVATDVTEDVIRELALPTGLVDVKVCAVDDVWSGLKLVRRLRAR